MNPEDAWMEQEDFGPELSEVRQAFAPLQKELRRLITEETKLKQFGNSNAGIATAKIADKTRIAIKKNTARQNRIGIDMRRIWKNDPSRKKRLDIQFSINVTTLDGGYAQPLLYAFSTVRHASAMSALKLTMEQDIIDMITNWRMYLTPLELDMKRTLIDHPERNYNLVDEWNPISNIRITESYTVLQDSIRAIANDGINTQAENMNVTLENMGIFTPDARLYKTTKKSRFERGLNAENAPEIPGLLSIPSGSYGCVVECIARHKRPTETMDTIMDRLYGPVPVEFEHEPEENPWELLPEADENGCLYPELPPAIQLQDLVDYFAKYNAKTRFYFHFIGSSHVIAVNCGDSYDHHGTTEHYTIHNSHVYAGKPTSFAFCKSPKQIRDFQFQPESSETSETLYKRLMLNQDNSCYMDFATNNYDSNQVFRKLVQYCVNRGVLPTIIVKAGSIRSVKLISELHRADGWSDRRELYEILRTRYPDAYELKQFTNQSWGSLGKTILEQELNLSGVESTDSIADRIKINCFKTTPHISRPCELPSSFGVDLNRAYLAVIERSDCLIGIYNSTDSFQPYRAGWTREHYRRHQFDLLSNDSLVGEQVPLLNQLKQELIPEAEYILDKICVDGIVHPSQIWSGQSVLRLIKLKVPIKPLEIRIPSKAFSTREIAKTFTQWRTDYPKFLKYLYTATLGFLGISKNTSTQSFLTTSRDEYDAGLESHSGSIIQVDETQPPVYMLYRSSDSETLKNLCPLYRYVIGEGTIDIIELNRQVLQKFPVSLVGVRVDCCYYAFNNFSSITSDTTKTTVETIETIRPALSALCGDRAKIELKQISLTCFNGSAVEPPAKSYNDLTACVKIPCLGKTLDGIAGSGKTTAVVNHCNQLENATIMLCGVMSACVQQLAQSIPNHKFALNTSQLAQRQNSIIPAAAATYATMCKTVTMMVVDEYSMLTVRDYDCITLFLNACMQKQGRYPTLWLVGDSKQINPVQSCMVNVQTHTAWSLLVPTEKKQFIAGSARYDYVDEINEFLTTRRLPEAFINRVVNTFVGCTNLAADNAMCSTVARQMVEQGIIDDKIIVSKNGSSASHAWTNGTIMLKTTADLMGIPASDKKTSLCITSHRCQGQSLGEYGIYQLIDMKFQNAYVVLSRARTLAGLSIVPNGLVSPAVYRDRLRAKRFEYETGNHELIIIQTRLDNNTIITTDRENNTIVTTDRDNNTNNTVPVETIPVMVTVAMLPVDTVPVPVLTLLEQFNKRVELARFLPIKFKTTATHFACAINRTAIKIDLKTLITKDPNMTTLIANVTAKLLAIDSNFCNDARV